MTVGDEGGGGDDEPQPPGDADDARPGRPALAFLTGARIQRVDGPEPTLFAVTLEGGRNREVLLLRVDGTTPAIGLVPTRPRGEPASGVVQRLRRTLSGARLTEAWADGDGGSARLRFTTRDGTVALGVVNGDPGGSVLVLADAEGRFLAGSPPMALRARGLRPGVRLDEGFWGRASPVTLDALRAAGARLVRGGAEDAARRRTKELRRRVKGTRARLDRKRRAIEADAARADEAPVLRRRATMLLASPNATPGAGGAIEVVDWELEPPARVELVIAPGETARSQAERWFHRARRVERGAGIARERLDATNAALRAVDAFLEVLDQHDIVDGELPPLPSMEDLEARWRDLGVDRTRDGGAPRSSRGGKRRDGRTTTRLPYRSFRGSGGKEIRVGRNAADNDSLTLRYARPTDMWLHARSIRGAHVVVPMARGEAVGQDLLLDAAMLAAHFSEARGEAVVEVQHTQRRYVRKPRGVATGAVLVEKEKTVPVRVEPERLRGLLATEKPPGP